jgi:hypothetical protein
MILFGLLFFCVYTFSVPAAPIGDSGGEYDDSDSVNTVLHQTSFNDAQQQWDHEEKQGIGHDPENYQIYTDLSLNHPEVNHAALDEARDLMVGLNSQVREFEEEVLRDYHEYFKNLVRLSEEAQRRRREAEWDPTRQAEITNWLDVETTLGALDVALRRKRLRLKKGDILGTIRGIERTRNYLRDRRNWEDLFGNTPQFNDAHQAWRELVAQRLPTPPPPPSRPYTEGYQAWEELAPHRGTPGQLLITDGSS